MFQSSPGLLAGRNLVTKLLPTIRPRFQSSSGLLTGCNDHSLPSSSRASPELFQSSSDLLAGCNHGCYCTIVGKSLRCFNPHPAFWPDATSDQHDYLRHRSTKFQSSPGLQAGCNNLVDVVGVLLELFQSSPGLLAGCNREVVDLSTPLRVSILTRPSGRMQPSPGATAQWVGSSKRFQSSPGLLAGCNFERCLSICKRPATPCFNPHPAFWPDATPRP